MSFNVEKYTNKGIGFINEVADKLDNCDNPGKAARVLKSILHALRNRITTEESLQLLSQLPLMIKGIYVDGWKLKNQVRIKNIEDFIDEIIKEDGASGFNAFSTTLLA